jgi:hypothetical protein
MLQLQSSFYPAKIEVQLGELISLSLAFEPKATPPALAIPPDLGG